MHLYINYRWIVTTSERVDKWTSCLYQRQSNIVSGRVDKWTSEQVACYKEKLVLMLLCLPLHATCLPIYSFTRLLINHVTLSLFASNLSTRLTCQLVNFCKDNSLTENQKGVNSIPINALRACKRCSLRPLLTPFWNPIKHLSLYDFITYWFSVSCRVTFKMDFVVTLKGD